MELTDEISRMEGEAGPAHPEEHTRPDAERAAASQQESPAESALREFVHSANWGILHPADNARFEEVMTLASAAQWMSTELESRLLRLGIPAQLAQELRRRYWNRLRPLPLAGTGRRELDEQIAQMNAKLGCNREVR